MKILFFNPARCLSLLTASILITSTLHAEPPVKVYILAGQSNMQGKGAVEGDGANSLRSMVKNDAKKFGFLVDDDGQWVEHKDAWIHYDLAPFRELRYGPLKPGFGAPSDRSDRSWDSAMRSRTPPKERCC